MTGTELLTTTETAKRLRVSPRTVARMADDGRLKPVLKLPGGTGAYLFAPADVEAFLSGRAS